MIRLVICEDEKNQQNLIKRYIEKVFYKLNIEYKIIIFNSSEELINNYPKDIDIFLLDIQMGKINGMDLAREIRKKGDKSSEIIFITSLVEYIQEGYEVRAYRYILKPIKYEDLEKHIINCINEKYENDKCLAINEKNVINKITINKITYIEIQKKDITIHTISRKYKIKNTMDNIEKEINSSKFYRCHKSFLVNLEYIESIKQYVAILDNKEEVPISRYRFKNTKDKFFSLIGNKL
ncbi:LytTR family DNA-binding domain-containing protein [Clostridioides difficile]|nr:LytTR family DNA-binding domain-containing protein [Clostridioides difficile]